jgi:hypothetical protein
MSGRARPPKRMSDTTDFDFRNLVSIWVPSPVFEVRIGTQSLLMVLSTKRVETGVYSLQAS